MGGRRGGRPIGVWRCRWDEIFGDVVIVDFGGPARVARSHGWFVWRVGWWRVIEVDGRGRGIGGVVRDRLVRGSVTAGVRFGVWLDWHDVQYVFSA